MKALQDFKRLLDQAFARDFAAGAKATASNVRGNDRRFAAGNVVDGKKETYWATDDTVTSAPLVLSLPKPETFNCVMLQEHIALGQRVEAFLIEQWNGNSWTLVASGTTIGHKRLLRFPQITASKLRVNIRQSKACPAMAAIGVFHAPEKASATER